MSREKRGEGVEEGLGRVQVVVDPEHLDKYPVSRGQLMTP